MAIEFNQDHRKIFAEKLLESANLALAGLVFGQFLSGKEFSVPIAIVGVIFVIILYLVAYLMLKKRRKK